MSKVKDEDWPLYTEDGGDLENSLRILDTFTPEEAETAAEKVVELRDIWEDRGHYWTLGATAYMDGPGKYSESAAARNPILKNYFHEEIGKIGDVLGELFDCSIFQLPRGGLPGFHIMRRSDVRGRMHLDVQYRNVLWPAPFMFPFTFTTLLRPPVKGTGLNYINGLDKGATQTVLRDIEATGNDDKYINDQTKWIPYEVGKTYVHAGRVLHAPPDMAQLEPDEYRITLQGFGAAVPEYGGRAIYF